MITGTPPTERDEHDTYQIRYFESTTKRTMVPKDTPYLRQHVDQALKAVRILPDERVLEVGSGLGRYTLILAQRGVRVEGMDMAPDLLRRLQEYNDGRFQIPLHCMSIETPHPALEGAFDVVLAFFTLHHVYNLHFSFKGIAHVLKPGGRAVFVEPNPLNILYYFQILVTPRMTWQGEKGILLMRPGILRQAMEAAGLEGFSMSRFGFFPPVLRNQRWGAAAEAALERIPFFKPFLPFQVFQCRKP